MKIKIKAMVRRRHHGQRGQSIVIAIACVAGLLAAAGSAVDMGSLYYASQQLQVATQESALAGAAVLGDQTAAAAIAQAVSFSAVNGDQNARSNLTNVTMVSGYPQVKCLTTTGIVCSASPADANAMVVSQQATVPTTFLKVIGISSLSITATATASAKGGYNGPYNVEIILDTTHSMNDTDSDSQCNNTRLSCALAGIRTLLSTLSPCAAGLKSCGTSSPAETATVGTNVANAVDEVGLMVFPGLASTAQVPNDWACPAVNPAITSYNNGPVYQIIAFSSDYRTSDSSPLNASSDTVIAVGGGCSRGVAAPGGEGTFYAGVIDTAQAQLVANARPNTKNVMILLSDGNASATGKPGCGASGSGNMAGCVTNYPATQECHQAITEAQKASAAGTIIYSVAYGAEASGCTTDTSPKITPCQTMQAIASSSLNFFSDYTATGGTSSCISSSRPTSNLNQIFQEIAGDLTVARLIPNNTQ
jgi:hypothetical protein